MKCTLALILLILFGRGIAMASDGVVAFTFTIPRAVHINEPVLCTFFAESSSLTDIELGDNWTSLAVRIIDVDSHEVVAKGSTKSVEGFSGRGGKLLFNN